GTVCVVGKMRDLILQLSKSSIYSTKPLIAFEEKYGSQLELLIRFLDRALGIGVIFKE
ncbi:hypothetical protein RAF25_07805, partial [Klebsiella pneumoniae]